MGRPKGFWAKNERGGISDTISNVSSLLCLSWRRKKEKEKSGITSAKGMSLLLSDPARGL
jgi:hypothetical protein